MRETEERHDGKEAIFEAQPDPARPAQAPHPFLLLGPGLATDPGRRPARDTRVAFTRAGDSAVLLDPRSGNYFSLSEVGADLWELCDGDRTIDDIVLELGERYDAPSQTILEDALELLHELEAEGLLAID